MMTAFNNFYKGKNVLVTGHTGFKGSWLSIWLKELGANVIGYSLEPITDRDNFVATNLTEKIVDIRGDIRDIDKLKSTFHKYKPEIVFHLAAQPLVRLSYEMPRETYEINVMGTYNILECIKECRSTKIGLMITTDKCYENKEQIWGYRETDPMGGYDPYSSSKGCAELLISSFRSSFLNPKYHESHTKAIASARAGNVIGGGDWSKDRIIPDCIRALEEGKSINIRNPKATRPWQHVLEPLSGYLWLGVNLYNSDGDFASAWNFGPDFSSTLTVGEIVNTIVNKWGSGNWVDLSGDEKTQLHEANLLSLDCTKAKSFLNWKPALNIDEALAFTIDWYKSYKQGNAYDFCREQISKYTDIAKSKEILWAID